MVKLQAATLSNQVIRKRKRQSQVEVTESQSSQHPIQINENETSISVNIPTKTHDGGPKPRRRRKGEEHAKPPTLRNDSSTFIETKIPWPDHFTKLFQTHKALNLVFTFCCTRKNFATTFDNLRAAVEGHIKRPLLVKDVTQIKALMPRAITFIYIDEALLEVDPDSSEIDQNNRAVSASGPSTTSGPETEHKEVLLFEFVDEDLKRQVQHAKTGEPTRATRKLRQEDVKMPVFSQKQMMKLIEKRNNKFTSAINSFLNKCAEEETDATKKLLEQVETYMPRPSDSRPATPVPNDNSKLPATIPKERKSIREILTDMQQLEWYSGQIVPNGHRVFDPQPPIYAELNFRLSQSLVDALYNTKNITKFYAHQAEAINNLHAGHNVIVSTSTSSGKSLIYQVPVLHELERDPFTRAMYIFPTKALAQDQRRSLKDLLRFMDGLQDIVVETFDGDTQMADRNFIRDEGRIIFTNPDMLHITILPQEQLWRTFLQNLKYVVVDELHVYNGLFGAHMALVMRRLRRICAAVGNRKVKFISCSATVANPEEHMKTIFGVDSVKLTDFDGSPSGRKEFICWNTPYKDPKDPSSGRGNALEESAKLFCQLILRGVRVIAFCRIRKMCEGLMSCIKTELTNLERPEAMARVMAYRGGYTPNDRRQIEKEMFDGKLVGIVATSALELGVDIGSLDAVVTVGFPYSIANLRQQSGRAGRRNKDSLSVLVGDCFPTDQFFMQNPDEIFTRPNCELQVDLENIMVFEGHVQCAAYEMPIRPKEDSIYFGPLLSKIAAERMRKDSTGYYHCNERFLPHPSRFVAIRDTEEEHFAIIDTTNNRNILLEELEASRAFYTIYDGGIFLHQGNTYLVKEFSQDRMLAKVERVKVDWITQQRDYTDIDPVETEAIRAIPGSPSRAFYGPIRVKQVVFGYFKLDKRRRILDAVQVDNPPIILMSKGMWLDIPKFALDILNDRRINVAGSIHAAEHAFLSLMPNFVISMPGDVRTECKVPEKEFAKKESSRKRPARLTFYDAKGGAAGSGISTKAFEFVDLLLKQACERVAACHCLEGCFECCCSERCKHANQVMSKAGAEVILRSLLNWEIDVDSLPWGPEERTPAGIETVVLAEEVRPRKGVNVEVLESIRKNRSHNIRSSEEARQGNTISIVKEEDPS
jgi:DEAD/DEAH box helicase domain-containing protein